MANPTPARRRPAALNQFLKTIWTLGFAEATVDPQ
jgi:hypothetical protein